MGIFQFRCSLLFFLFLSFSFLFFSFFEEVSTWWNSRDLERGAAEGFPWCSIGRVRERVLEMLAKGKDDFASMASPHPSRPPKYEIYGSRGVVNRDA